MHTILNALLSIFKKPTVISTLSIDSAGWVVGPGTTRIPSVRSQALVCPTPIGVVWHYTNTPRGTAETLARRIAEKPKVGVSGTSVHFWIEADGSVYQSVSCLRGAWHAGGVSSKRFTVDKDKLFAAKNGLGVSANSWSIGIELVNQGRVKKCDDGRWRPWPFSKTAQVIDEKDIEKSPNGRFWQKYTDEQLTSAKALLNAIRLAYPKILKENLVIGHSDLDPTRRDDPGPNFLAKFKEFVND